MTVTLLVDPILDLEATLVDGLKDIGPRTQAVPVAELGLRRLTETQCRNVLIDIGKLVYGS